MNTHFSNLLCHKQLLSSGALKQQLFNASYETVSCLGRILLVLPGFSYVTTLSFKLA